MTQEECLIAQLQYCASPERYFEKKHPEPLQMPGEGGLFFWSDLQPADQFECSVVVFLHLEWRPTLPLPHPPPPAKAFMSLECCFPATH